MDWKVDLKTLFSDLCGKRNALKLALLWLAGALVLVGYGSLSGHAGEFPGPFSIEVPARGPSSTGAFVAWRPGWPSGQGASYTIAFHNLSAGTDDPGAGPTPGGKVVCIDNLDLEFLSSHNTRDGGGTPVELCDFYRLFAPPCDGGVLGVLHGLTGETPDWALALDLTNTAQVRIDCVDWRVCQDGRVVFRARCGQAVLQKGTSEVLLRGQATVAARNALLESRDIRMDTRRNCLVADGPYVLTRGGAVYLGVGGCFSTELDPAANAPVPFVVTVPSEKIWLASAPQATRTEDSLWTDAVTSDGISGIRHAISDVDGSGHEKPM